MKKAQAFDGYKADVEASVQTTLDNVLGSANYDTDEVGKWVDTITAGVLEKLQKMSDAFKYIVTVVVLQRSNSGFHLFSTCYWDQALDGTATVQWDNKTMHCIVTVFGVAL